MHFHLEKRPYSKAEKGAQLKRFQVQVKRRVAEVEAAKVSQPHRPARPPPDIHQPYLIHSPRPSTAPFATRTRIRLNNPPSSPPHHRATRFQSSEADLLADEMAHIELVVGAGARPSTAPGGGGRASRAETPSALETLLATKAAG